MNRFIPTTHTRAAGSRTRYPAVEPPTCVRFSSPSTAPGNGTTTATFRRDGTDNDQCVVSVLGLQVNTASFAMYTFSLAVLVQALTLISFSALADYGEDQLHTVLVRLC